MSTPKFWIPYLEWDSIVADRPVAAGGDVDVDPEIKGIYGGCEVTGYLSKGDARAIRALTTPKSKLYALGSQDVRLDDGFLSLTAAQEQFGLLAKSDVLDLDDIVDIVYSFRFHHVTYNGKPQDLPTIVVKAPELAEDVIAPWPSVNLADMEWLDESTAVGGGFLIRQVPDDVIAALSGTAAQFMANGFPLGDPLVLPSAAWGSIIGKPTVIGAGADAAAARAAIGGTTVGGNVFTAADATAARTALGAQAELYFDLRKYGAVCNGTTDDTAAWTAAVAAAVAAGGGLIWWRGTTVASQIHLASKVGICGLGTGVSTITQKAGRSAGQHLILLDEADATDVVLRDFTVNGNRAAQTGQADGIHLDNTAGAGVLAHHMIRNVEVRSVAGNGIYWGYQMRSSLVDGVVIYFCDGYGFHGSVFSDSTIQNMDIGQSGLHGMYLDTCFNLKVSNIKAWYSGRITAGSAGIWQRNGAVHVYSNIATQENSGSGMVLQGTPSAIPGVTVRGFNSDSDNTQASSSNSALLINNVNNSIFDVAVSSEAPLAGTPFAGVNIAAGSGNKVTANVDPTAVSWILHGNTIGNNDVDLCRGTTSSTPSGAFTPAVYQYREHRVTLTANRTVNNPSTPSSGPPVGMPFRFVFIQDATGGRVPTFSSAYKIPASVRFDTTASSRTVIDFVCVADGDWQMVGLTTDGIGVRRVIATLTGSSTLAAAALTDYVTFLGAGAAPTLPTAVGNTSCYTFKNIDTANRTVATTSSQTVEGVTGGYILPPGASIDVMSDGANWRIL